MKYDPTQPIDAESWLAIDEGERLELVRRYHEEEEPHPPAPSPQSHAAFHNIVETQVAMDERVNAVLLRLIDEGLTRHNAIHAMGAVISKHVFDALQEKRPVDEDAYMADLEKVDGKEWLKNAE